MTSERDGRANRQKVCVWCGCKKFGSPRCVCDSPRYEMMEACEACGEWTDVDKIREVDENFVCPDCEAEVLYS